MPKILKHDNRNYHECKWCNKVIHLNVLGEWEHNSDGSYYCNGAHSRHIAAPKDNCECNEEPEVL